MRVVARGRSLLVVAVVTAAFTAAIADSPAPKRTIELFPAIGVRGGASMEAAEPGVPPAEADASASFGFGVDVFLRPDGWFEAFVDRQTLRFDRGAEAFGTSAFDLTIDYLQFGGGYEPQGGRVHPYVTAALGLTYYAASSGTVGSSTGLSASIGGGVKVPVGKTVALRFELRGYGTSGTTAVSVVSGPGLTLEYATSGWYQVAFRAGVSIRI